MSYEVQVEPVAGRQLAAARGSMASRAELASTIRRLLDEVWSTLRAQGVRTGHNVVVYYGGPLTIAAGVEVPDGFAPNDGVQPISTPHGEAAHVVYWGDYAQMADAYTALDTWFEGAARSRTGVSWEVYGDWDQDPRRLRTDIYFQLETGV